MMHRQTNIKLDLSLLKTYEIMSFVVCW